MAEGLNVYRLIQIGRVYNYSKNIFLFCTEFYTLSTFSGEKVNGNTMYYVINVKFTFLLESRSTRGFVEKVEHLFLSF